MQLAVSSTGPLCSNSPRTSPAVEAGEAENLGHCMRYATGSPQTAGTSEDAWAINKNLPCNVTVCECTYVGMRCGSGGDVCKAAMHG